MSSGCTKVAVTMTILLLYLFISAETCSFIRTTGNWCVCVCQDVPRPTCPHVCTCPAHVCACRTAAACPSYGCGHAGTDVKSRPRSARRTSGGRHQPPSPFTHCLTSDQTWEPCLTMIGMERNRILKYKGLGLACLSMKIFRTIIPVSVTCLFL